MDADCLSRRHDVPTEDEEGVKQLERISKMLLRSQRDPNAWKSWDSEVCKAIIQVHTASPEHSAVAGISIGDSSYIETLPSSENSIPEEFGSEGCFSEMFHDQNGELPDWKKLQRRDKYIAKIIHYLQRNHRPTWDEEKKEEYETRLYLREWPRLFLLDGVLHRKVQRKGEVVEQLVIPYTHRRRALEGIHDDMGHFGVERTLDLARDRFFWPKMTQEIEVP